jgi:hypothetical protein
MKQVHSTQIECNVLVVSITNWIGVKHAMLFPFVHFHNPTFKSKAKRNRLKDGFQGYMAFEVFFFG